MAETRFSRDECDHCGEAIPANARRCRTCGADADVGWAEPQFDDYGDDDFDYDGYIQREFPDERSAPIRQFWINLVLALLALSFILSLFA